MGHSFPRFVDSALCIGVILHSLCSRNPGVNALSLTLPGTRGLEVRPSCIYFLAGYYCFLSALSLVPYKALYAMAAVGVISFTARVIGRRNREKGEGYFSSRKHSHKHWPTFQWEATSMNLSLVPYNKFWSSCVLLGWDVIFILVYGQKSKKGKHCVQLSTFVCYLVTAVGSDTFCNF